MKKDFIFVFVPGMWDPKNSFDQASNRLKELGCSFVVVEYDHEDYKMGFNDYLKILTYFVRKVKSRNENSKIILVCHCLGLPLGLKAAEVTGIVSGIVNLSGAPFKLGHSWENVWNFRYLFGKIMKRPFRYLFPIVFGRKVAIHDSDVNLLTSDVKIAEDWGKKREPSSGKVARELMRGIAIDLAKIPPVVNVICTQDKIISLALQEKVAKRLGGASLYLDCGHWGQIEKPGKIILSLPLLLPLCYVSE